ncbi:hypothetical protein PAMP_005140 [Pampus punctatissimus]
MQLLYIYCTMQFTTLFFLLILCGLCPALAQDCCLKYVKKLSNGTQRFAVKYRRQETDGGCNIPAIIFTMKRGRVFCTDPKEKWVSELMKRVDRKAIHNDRRDRGKDRRS